MWNHSVCDERTSFVSFVGHHFLIDVRSSSAFWGWDLVYQCRLRPSILKQLPISIEKRLSSISSSEAVFDQSKGHYQEALRKSDHNYELRYNPQQRRRGRNRARKVIWYNPPFSKTVKTNIGRKFLQLLDAHFPENNRFHKIFNRSTVKVSYGCMPNIGAAINSHNRSVLEERQPLERGGCNCREGSTCPLAGECLTGNVLYDATLTSNLRNYGEKLYIGISEPEFKKRFGNHTKSFRDKAYSKDTELSKEIWRLKEKNATFEVRWKIRRLYTGNLIESKITFKSWEIIISTSLGCPNVLKRSCNSNSVYYNILLYIMSMQLILPAFGFPRTFSQRFFCGILPLRNFSSLIDINHWKGIWIWSIVDALHKQSGYLPKSFLPDESAGMKSFEYFQLVRPTKFWFFLSLRNHAKFIRYPGRAVNIDRGARPFLGAKKGAKIFWGRKKGRKTFLKEKKGGEDFF